MSDTSLDQCRQLLAQAVEAAKPLWQLGDGKGTFIVDELRKQMVAAGLGRQRKAVGLSVLRFEEFWQAYPKKVDKQGCMRKWSCNNLDLLADQIIEHVGKRCNTVGWTKEGGKFIPMPSTYLNQRRWEEEGVGTPSSDRWAKEAGFSDVYEAENAGCRQHNAEKYRNGVRIAP